MNDLQAPWVGKTPEEYYGYDDEPKVLYHCEGCDSPIREGDTYYDIFGTYMCEDCINDVRKTAEE